MLESVATVVDSLPGWRFVYVFLQCTDVHAQREFMQDVLGLPLVEDGFHPPHAHHGVYKFDAGSVVIGLDLVDPAMLSEGPDGVRFDFAMCGDPFCELPKGPETNLVDPSGHCYTLALLRNSRIGSVLTSIKLNVSNLEETLEFYSGRLGLESHLRNGEWQALAGNLTIKFSESVVPPAGWRSRAVQLVLYSIDACEAVNRLRRRNISVGDPIETKIGWTAQFCDPDSHRLCLYQPSTEALRWSSGPAVSRIITRGAWPA